MNKKEFGEVILREMAERLGEGLQLKLQEVRKNNNVTLLGLVVSDVKRNIAPTLYLDELFLEHEKKGNAKRKRGSQFFHGL